ncbi:HpcH/HpaI aldolase/citrate lyase family protein [Dietzia maris]|jgi:citrate lyase subunit beta/citryl-CoA lyase|uniref:HpcH/HpaI aldolase/citrate lyase family protein n=1 Tax=Dietzia TaxID=37914 RepID=UPI0022B38A10|nr:MULTISPECIES: CoA ester lyase [Dietzia]MBB0995266.1 CoA ester lyase [Dietzia sp. SLG510A3-40A3]MBB1008295.1 CoA ester lyase [Dietzia sp. SLG510A3-3B2-2]MCZ4538701.1 CoA ester lyase [Dietzia maris]MCZ4655039.1 CoA ester lyase [Dietzia kunjamensis]MDV3355194.1 CoA ester lyase [Dietzia sp. IN118]
MTAAPHATPAPSEDAATALAELRARPRRTVLAVPGSSVKMIDKARGLPVDEVFLDLEDAVAGPAKEEARQNVVAALNGGDFAAPTVVVRVNAWDTEYTVRDVTEIVGRAGARVDALLLPKARSAAEVVALDLVLTQVEKAAGLPVGHIGIEPQIEDALGLTNIDQIATASPRVLTLVFGPADFMASVGMRTLTVGEQPEGYAPGDAYHHVLMTILVAARAHGLQAIDGPFLKVRDVEGFRRAAARTAALGFDGKWVLHPAQVDAGNEVFSPRQEEFDQAEAILAAYARSTSVEGGARGAVMFGDEMLDEASRKMAMVVSARGRAGGMTVTDQAGAGTDPEGRTS